MITWHDTGGQGTPKWFKLRKGLWTGYTSIRLLTGKRLLPESEWQGNDYTRRGHALEVAAIREYERKYRVKVQRPDFVTNSVYPNAGYSPDGIDHGWLLECKALNGLRHEELVERKIPLQHLAQMFFGCIITGKRKIRLLAFNPEYEEQLTVIGLEYDKLIGNNIRRKLRLDMKKRKGA